MLSINGNFILKLGIKSSCWLKKGLIYIYICSFVLVFNVSSHCQFMNQTRQGMAMKMENMGNPGMRPGMQPGMGGQVPYKSLCYED